MSASLIEGIRKSLSESSFLATLAEIRPDGGRRFALGACSLRNLLPKEIEGLEKAGCSALDWSEVLVADDFDYRRLQRVRFLRNVVLGNFLAQSNVTKGVTQPAGIYDSVLGDCVIGHDALVDHVRMLSHVVVGPRAIIWNCGRIVCTGSTTFGSDNLIRVGPQVNGRQIPFYPELDVATAAVLATCHDHAMLGEFEAIRADYRAQSALHFTVLCADSRMLQTETVENCFVGFGSTVDGCPHLANSTLLGSMEEPVQVLRAASIQSSILQWGSRVESGASVTNSLVAEYACVQDQGSLTDSVLGPNSVIGRGEVGACLLGPFVALHHQSMLISTVWPEGRGNISSGANVGANHTGRAPDQEFWPGEGMFVGLGVNVRFPSDFTLAPYSVLACSVTTSPQRVEFPFSLINSPTHVFPDLSPTLNQIIPGWLLTDSLYTLVRNERKYRDRNHARRMQFDFRILRPNLYESLRESCRRLESVNGQKAVYTSRDIAGLGKNYLLEEVRGAALRGYRWFLRLDGLRRLQQLVVECVPTDTARARDLLNVPSHDPIWESQRRWLAERERLADVDTALGELTQMLNQFARDVERSKAKDDLRGIRTREDYSSTHIQAQDDPVVQETWAEMRQEIAGIEKVREQLKQ
ncbi:hypothetical protein BH10PLA2_BH10PLA2_36660 [soil metagenome]